MSRVDSIVLGGLGQVGSAIVQMAENAGSVAVHDLKVQPKDTSCSYLHVTIPYTPSFKETVLAANAKYLPDVTIVHSTVPVGTTRDLGISAAHSPVRGQHDDLYESMKRFVKYVGVTNDSSRDKAYSHLINCGFTVQSLGTAESTELAKLLCLSRYMNDISFYEVADRLCKKYDVDPEVVKMWTSTYNSGYRGTKWVRPDLDFPKGKVGGHCVAPVSKMLYDQSEDKWLLENLKLFNLA